MSTVLAIDPGSERSAWVLLERDDGSVVDHGIESNDWLVERFRNNDSGLTINVRHAVIEWMSPRGMPTSAQEFETLYWVGRFAEALHIGENLGVTEGREAVRITRLKVKMHVCGSAKANDTNIRAALIDRYGGTGGKAAAVGLKKTPGPLFGIASDEWAALALAVTWADQHA